MHGGSYMHLLLRVNIATGSCLRVITPFLVIEMYVYCICVGYVSNGTRSHDRRNRGRVYLDGLVWDSPVAARSSSITAGGSG